jgi:Domain of unknown function (DUF4157)
MTDLHGMDSADKMALRRRASEGEAAPAHETTHPLLRLQSQVGNAPIARLFAQREAQQDEEDEGAVHAKHDPGLAQRQGDDEEVQARHDGAAQRAADEEDSVQAKHENVGLAGGPVGPDTVQRIQAKRGSGSELDTGLRSSMEHSLGTSFADVRVHQDGESDTLNRRLTAKAFTTGSDIFLRSDVSRSDTHLMAHELTHVVQQRSMSGGGGGMSVGAAGDAKEHEADSVADAVHSAPAPTTPAPAQRQADEEAESSVQAEHDPALAQRAEEDEDKEQGT